MKIYLVQRLLRLACKQVFLWKNILKDITIIDVKITDWLFITNLREQFQNTLLDKRSFELPFFSYWIFITEIRQYGI